MFKCLGLSLVVGTGVAELFCLSFVWTRKYSVLLTMLLKISYHILQYFPMYFNQELEISECLKQVSKVCQSSNSQCYIKPVPTLHFSSTLHGWPNIEASRFDVLVFRIFIASCFNSKFYLASYLPPTYLKIELHHPPLSACLCKNIFKS